jgi:hypothetical protein
MNRAFTKDLSWGAGSRRIALFCMAAGACVMGVGETLTSARAEPLKGARVSQVIQDVKLLGSAAAPRPAAVNDRVNEGTAVRTGIQSRAELTFTDLTITRLGENTVFTFGKGARELDLATGSVLVEVPPKAQPARINTAAVSAAVTGGTGMFATGPPVKFMVLEGTGTFYPAGHPEEAVTLHGGEMIMLTPDGHILGPLTFDVKTVMGTSHLIVDFPDLANLPLILDVINQQILNVAGGPSPPPQKSNVDLVDLRNAASPTPTASPTPSGTPSKFGPPSTIGSPAPYVITSATQIQTDPAITTNGVTNYGKVYQGQAIDGAFSAWAFGSTSSFDTASGFDSHINSSGAVFKFTSLSLAGDPIIDTTNGETSLGLIGVTSVISANGGVLTFPGITGLLIASEAGPVNLGSDISFNGPADLNFYARGATSDLTLDADATSSNNVRLYAGRNIQLNSSVTTPNFFAFSGGDFFANAAGTNLVADNIDVQSLSNITIDSAKIPDPLTTGGAIIFNAAGTMDLALAGGGTFTWDSLNIQGMTVNLTNPTPTTFDFSQSSSVMVTAGTGGINASNIEFFGLNLTLTSGGDISVFSATTPLDMNDDPILSGSISATGSFDSSGDVATGMIHVGNNITIGGRLDAVDIQADAGTIDVTNGIKASGGSITAGADITTAGVLELGQNPPGTFGNISAGGDINADGGIFTPGDPAVVMAGGSITAPAVITGTLQAGTDITIDNTAEDFDFGIVANHIMAGGTLNLIDAPSISPNNASSVGHDGLTFNDFTMTVGAISSTGPTFATLSSNGGDANPDFADSNPGNGGNITLTTTAGGVTLGEIPTLSLKSVPTNGGVLAAISTPDLDSIQANGGAYNVSGPFGGGNGGTIDITAAGDVLVEFPTSEGPAISATTGLVADPSSQFEGAGGTVNITSAGTTSVDGTIQVSSNDVNFVRGVLLPGRASASGGNINMTSTKTTGVAINVGSSGQLLALLNAAAPGPGGKITIVASNVANNASNNSSINVDNSYGQIVADRGTVEIRHDGDGGQINLTNANIRADIVKIGALGNNGTLTIGGGAISADSLLNLYATGSNGTLKFISNVTLSSGTAANLAANTITIQPSVVVTIAGTGGAANVYTNNANYNGFGGTNPSNGTFGGNGANNPQPLSNAPSFH